jgi:hypothetical protein
MAWTERYVRADAAGGGAGTADNTADAWTLAEAIANVTAGMRVNIRAGTYANGTTSRNFNVAGNIWWRGFNSTPGDLDANPAYADMPLITFTGTSARAQATAAQQRFSAIAFESADNSGTFNPSGVGVQVKNCSFKNTGAGTAFLCGVTGCNVIGCYMETASTTNQCVSMASANQLYQCCFVVGGKWGLSTGFTGCNVVACVVKDSTEQGIYVEGNVSLFVDSCTIYNIAQDGVRRQTGTTNAAQVRVRNTVFSVIGGYAFGNSGTDFGIASLMMDGCLYHSLTSGQVNGVADPINENVVTDSGSPFEDAAAGDFRLKTTSNGYGTAIPGTFMRTTLDTVLDRGAVQRLRTGGGGGIGKLLGNGLIG